ncbi:MAG: extracellular solute-binding protein [Reichenbachiella sp.]
MRIAVRKFDPFESALQKQWEAFCQSTGCTLTLEAIPMDLHPLYEATLGKEDGLVKGKWDIAYLNTDWITEAKENGKLWKLNDMINEKPPEEFPEGWSDSLLGMQNFDGDIYGIPFHDGPECLVYRKDLFESEKEKEAFEKEFNRALRPPNTWVELIEIATFFQRPEDNLYGTVVAAFPDGHNTVFDLCLQVWARGGDIVDAKGSVDIDSQAAIEGLTFYRNLLRNTDAIHPKSPEMDSVQSGMAFARGEVAMMVNWFGFASMCEVLEESKVKGKVDVVRMPGASNERKGVSLNAYWMYTIGSGSEQKQIAYDFIQFASNVDNDKLLTLEGGIGCRKSTWFDKEVNASVPYYHRLDELHKNSKTLPRKAHWSQIGNVIDEVVLQAINTNDPIENILKEGQNKIKVIEHKYS